MSKSCKIPFVSNTPDGTHCFQAALAMILSFFNPQKSYSVKELDEISDKIEGKWTWPTAAMLWLVKNGYEVRLIEDFDFEDFADRGAEYIRDKCGPEVASAQEKNSDIKKEAKYAREFAGMKLLERRLPSFADVRNFLEDGYLLICNINSAALSNRPGYSGHFVVVYECDDKTVALHDPGLPPRPSVNVPLADFERAWAYPAASEKNLLAVKKLSS